MIKAPDPITHVEVKAWRGRFLEMDRKLPEESAVALSYDRVTFAVMMASPQDLQDFAIGFSLSEGIIQSPDEILNYELAVLPLGLECRMELRPDRREALEARRRRIAGPVGCGLCGMDSLIEAIKPPKPVHPAITVPADKIQTAIRRLPELQVLNRETRAVHAAAFYTPEDDALIVREDVGRHNGLDKLIGAVKAGRASGPGGGGAAHQPRLDRADPENRRVGGGYHRRRIGAERPRRARGGSGGDDIDRRCSR